MSSVMKWRIKTGHDQRFRSGHPWVYSNELMQSPSGIEPGEAVELQDSSGKFLARGFGNPGSLIAFRALSRDPAESAPLSREGFGSRIREALQMREALGLANFSHRLCFGEADGLSGLVIDRYLLEDSRAVVVLQAHAAGMDRALPEVIQALQDVLGISGEKDSWSLLIRNDVGVRKLEGLAEEPVKIEWLASGMTRETLSQAKVKIRAPRSESLILSTDLLAGQKTGLFLDQSTNLLLASEFFGPGVTRRPGRAIRILDLCCYVGQWGTVLAREFIHRQGAKVEVTGVDASAKALEFASRNVESIGAKFKGVRGDVLEKTEAWGEEPFDLVVCDPPAFVKGRKDLPQGSHAYLQLNTRAIAALRPGGAMVSCSCSSLMDEDHFVKILSKAAWRNRAAIRWIGRGTQGADHPFLAQFPEGRYLKAFFGIRGDDGA